MLVHVVAESDAIGDIQSRVPVTYNFVIESINQNRMSSVLSEIVVVAPPRKTERPLAIWCGHTARTHIAIATEVSARDPGLTILANKMTGSMLTPPPESEQRARAVYVVSAGTDSAIGLLCAMPQSLDGRNVVLGGTETTSWTSQIACHARS